MSSVIDDAQILSSSCCCSTTRHKNNTRFYIKRALGQPPFLCWSMVRPAGLVSGHLSSGHWHHCRIGWSAIVAWQEEREKVRRKCQNGRQKNMSKWNRAEEMEEKKEWLWCPLVDYWLLYSSWPVNFTSCVCCEQKQNECESLAPPSDLEGKGSYQEAKAAVG